MKIKTFKDGLVINLTKHKTLEVWINFWNPLNYIAFQRSFELRFKGDHAPQFNFNFSFIFFNFELSIYDIRHKDEK